MRARTGTRSGKVPSPAKGTASRTRASAHARTATASSASQKATVRLFVSYCHANAAAQAKLKVHLAQLERDDVETWFDGEMEAGDALNSEISRKLRAAHIFVALMSPEYLASHWCQLEYKRAMGRRARGLMRVVVVVVRPCDWKSTRASELKVLPRDGRPVSNWRTADDAFSDVTQGIRRAVRVVRASMTESAKAKPVQATKPSVAVAAKKTPPARRAALVGKAKAKLGAGIKRSRPSRKNVDK